MMPEQTSATQLLRVIQAEYLEIPGLHLTQPQVQRLWSLDAHTCDACWMVAPSRCARCRHRRSSGSRPETTDGIV
jgi:hypothetical protein